MVTTMDWKLHNRKYLNSTRRDLRNHMMLSEARLWDCLKEKQLEGRKFRRQHSIGNYVVDFYCPSEKLIVEVDGKSHDNIGTESADLERDKKLNAMGFRVLRIPAVDVRDNIAGVLMEIASRFFGAMRFASITTPAPLLEKEGKSYCLLSW